MLRGVGSTLASADGGRDFLQRLGNFGHSVLGEVSPQHRCRREAEHRRQEDLRWQSLEDANTSKKWSLCGACNFLCDSAAAACEACAAPLPEAVVAPGARAPSASSARSRSSSDVLCGIVLAPSDPLAMVEPRDSGKFLRRCRKMAHRASRRALVETLFAGLDRNGAGVLGCTGMHRLACKCGFDGDMTRWEDEYAALCDNFGIDSDVGIDLELFAWLMDQADFKGRCTDDELRALLLEDSGLLVRQAGRSEIDWPPVSTTSRRNSVCSEPQAALEAVRCWRDAGAEEESDESDCEDVDGSVGENSLDKSPAEGTLVDVLFEDGIWRIARIVVPAGRYAEAVFLATDAVDTLDFESDIVVYAEASKSALLAPSEGDSTEVEDCDGDEEEEEVADDHEHTQSHEDDGELSESEASDVASTAPSVASTLRQSRTLSRASGVSMLGDLEDIEKFCEARRTQLKRSASKMSESTAATASPCHYMSDMSESEDDGDVYTEQRHWRGSILRFSPVGETVALAAATVGPQGQ